MLLRNCISLLFRLNWVVAFFPSLDVHPGYRCVFLSVSLKTEKKFLSCPTSFDRRKKTLSTEKMYSLFHACLRWIGSLFKGFIYFFFKILVSAEILPVQSYRLLIMIRDFSCTKPEHNRSSILFVFGIFFFRCCFVCYFALSANNSRFIFHFRRLFPLHSFLRLNNICRMYVSQCTFLFALYCLAKA